MLRKASRMSRFDAKIAGTYGNVAEMVAEHRRDPVKCLMPRAHSVGRRLKFRSNHAMTGRSCAGTASPQAADKTAEPIHSADKIYRSDVRTGKSGLFLNSLKLQISKEFEIILNFRDLILSEES